MIRPQTLMIRLETLMIRPQIHCLGCTPVLVYSLCIDDVLFIIDDICID